MYCHIVTLPYNVRYHDDVTSNRRRSKKIAFGGFRSENDKFAPVEMQNENMSIR